MSNLSQYELEVSQAYNEANDYETLAEKLNKLMDNENSVAIYHLGTLYENGNGVEQDNHNALSHYILADKMGLPQAKYQMGITCEFGRCGVGQSYEVAAKIYKEASDLGHSGAQCQLGGLYERGYGVEQSHETAAHYYKLAAKNGNATATFLLADCYMNGIGVIKSVTEALNLHHQAAQLGNGNSQLILSVKYKHGDDLPVDYVKAYKYANLASSSASSDSDKEAAIGLRDEIFALMSDDEKKAILLLLNPTKD